MLILGFLGMYFDTAVVFSTNSSLLFRMAMAMLCIDLGKIVVQSDKGTLLKGKQE